MRVTTTSILLQSQTMKNNIAHFNILPTIRKTNLNPDKEIPQKIKSDPQIQTKLRSKWGKIKPKCRLRKTQIQKEDPVQTEAPQSAIAMENPKGKRSKRN